MRKLSIFILFIVMAVSLCGFIACGDKPESSSESVENQSQSESVHVHSIEKVDEKAPTCDEDGNIAYYYCEECDFFFADADGEERISKYSVIVEATHSLAHFEKVMPEGENNGTKEHWFCDLCEKYFLDENAENETDADSLIIVSALKIPDFIVEVESGKNPVVLQLTDTQIIDNAQARPGRNQSDYYGTDKMDERCFNYLTETINATKPDFIIITGDLVYGEFDDNGTSLISLINFMESFKIPWSPVFGNHDNESKKGVDWQCQQLEAAEYCYFEQKTLTGNGNYSIGISQNGKLTRVFYMLDSNGCGNASAQSLANGHTTTRTGFGNDQIEWYTEEITMIKEVSPDTKISFAYHIQQSVFQLAFNKYGLNSGDFKGPLTIDTHPDKKEGDFGHFGNGMKGPWDTSLTVWKGMVALGVDSVFVGHEHLNNASVVVDGIRFQFGQKSSEYDRFNWRNADGTIGGGYSMPSDATSLMGGTVIPLSEEDGSILNPYIYYCGDVMGTNP